MKYLKATITLEYSDVKTAKAIAKAVSPDNLTVPVGLQIITVSDDCKVVTDIVCEKKMVTFIATVDDLLFNVSVAEKALKIMA